MPKGHLGRKSARKSQKGWLTVEPVCSSSKRQRAQNQPSDSEAVQIRGLVGRLVGWMGGCVGLGFFLKNQFTGIPH